MKTYLATWEIEVTADSPEDAARQARAAQLRPETLATVFDVRDDQGELTRIDLSELDQQPA